MKISRKDMASLGLLPAAILFIFPLRAFSPSALLASKYSDVITQFLPHQLFIRRSLLEDGCLPLWNPYECCGTPAFPNPLYPLFAFPHILLIPLPPPLALNLGFILHVFLAGALMYALARSWDCSLPASLLAAFIYAFCARSLSHVQSGLYSRMIFYAFIPLLFLCAERCLIRPSVRSAAAMAFSLLLALLSGEMQLLIYSCLFLLLYSVLRLALQPPGMARTAPSARALSCLFLGMLVFIPLSAFYLLPGTRLYPFLTRSWPLGEARFAFMPGFRSLALLLNAMLFEAIATSGETPWESALYAGIIPLALIACLGRTSDGRRFFLLWGIPACAALLLSLRTSAPVHALLYRFIPTLGAFRNPGRMLYLLPLFISALAAKALDSLAWSAVQKGNRRKLLVPVCAVVALVPVLGWSAHCVYSHSPDALVEKQLERISAFFGKDVAEPIPTNDLRDEMVALRHEACISLMLQMFALALSCGLLLAHERGRLRGEVFAGLLIAVVAAEMLYSGRHWIEAHSLEEIYPRSAISAGLPEARNEYRLLDTIAPAEAPFWAAYPFYESVRMRIRRTDGYTPINLKAYVLYADLLAGREPRPLPRWSVGAPTIHHPFLLSLLNTEYVLSRDELSRRGFELMQVFHGVPVYKQFVGPAKIPRLLLYRNMESLPRAWLVPAAEPCVTDEQLPRLLSIDPRSVALVGPGVRSLSDGEPFRPVRILRSTPNRIETEVRTERPAYLVLSEIWAPGWMGTDDGVPVEVERVNGIFRGMYLEPGTHSLSIAYFPPGLGFGLIISTTTALVLVMLCVITRTKRAYAL